MKSGVPGFDLARSLLVIAAFCFVSSPTVAQKNALEAKEAMPSPASPSVGAPASTDGHPDLTGLWWEYRGANLDVQQVGNTRVNLQPTSRAPESEDPENNLSVNTRIYDSVAARRASPDKPSYKPELMPKVARLDRIEAKVDPAMIVSCPELCVRARRSRSFRDPELSCSSTIRPMPLMMRFESFPPTAIPIERRSKAMA